MKFSNTSVLFIISVLFLLTLEILLPLDSYVNTQACQFTINSQLGTLGYILFLFLPPVTMLIIGNILFRKKKINLIISLLPIILLVLALYLFLTPIWCYPVGITCVSSPINEMVTRTQQAQAGIAITTSPICLNVGEEITDTNIINNVATVNSVGFFCNGAAVCKNQDPIDVSDQKTIKARNAAIFKAKIQCTSDNRENYHCDIMIINT